MTDELYTQTEGGIRYWTREELLIRAETAEAEVAALQARVAELEADARWHLVNDPPGAAGWYLGWTGRRIEIVRYLPEYEGDEIDWPWQDGDDDEIEIIYWSSLRNRPQEAPAV